MLKRWLQGMVAVVVVLTASPATAETTIMSDGVPVYLNGDVLVRFRTWSSGFSPSERADLFEQRLRRVLNGVEVQPESLRLQTISGQPTILLGGQRLVTVTAADARANRTTPARLAQAWRGNLDASIRKYNATWDDGHRTVVIERTPPPNTQLTTLSRPEREPSAGVEVMASPYGATEVILNGVKVLRFRTSAGGFSPQERYVAFQQNLQAGLDPGMDGSDVTIRSLNGLPAIYLGRQYLCTVTEADAAANGTTPRTLAGIWANNLRRAVSRIDRY